MPSANSLEMRSQ